VTPPQSRSATTVVLLVGSQRTGSTLVSTALGMFSGAWYAGEVKLFWQSLSTRQLCSCGEACDRCAVWRRIIEATFSSQEEQDQVLPTLAVAEAEVLRLRRLAWLARQESPLPELGSYFGRLYSAIASTTGSRVIVDSSKHPSMAMLLGSVPDLDLRIVHLVRDARGVVDSWSRDKPSSGTPAHARQSAARAAAGWTAMHAGIELVLARAPVPTMRQRFEDFLEDPVTALSHLAEFCGIERGVDSPIEGRTLSIDPIRRHGIAGNVDRFQAGPVELLHPDTWRETLNQRVANLVLLGTFPLLRRYGYVGGPRSGGSIESAYMHDLRGATPRDHDL
jgi:hypothetical protein